MIVCTSNHDLIVDVGSQDIWNSVYSTIVYHLLNAEVKYKNAMSIFTKGKVSSDNALVAAREMNMIRDELSQVAPNKVIYDINNLNVKPPWGDNISPVITSCMNYFTTADGKDLLFEIVNIFVHSSYYKVDVLIEDF